MVSCSHMFIDINLKNTKVLRVNLASIYNAYAILESNKTPGEKRRNGEAKLNNTLENNEHIYAGQTYRPQFKKRGIK